MHSVTRRRFLAYSGAAGVAAAAAAAGIISWDTIASRAIEAPLAPGTRILVIVTLYGGNDGLGTVIPYSDATYQSARGDFAYAADEVLPLGEQLGLNPALVGMSGLWSKNQLAVVRGVGYPKPDRSHFTSMDIWQTASPQAPVNTGWIGRWLDAGNSVGAQSDPLRAVNMGTVLPPLAVGANSAAAALSLGASSSLDAATSRAIAGLGLADPADTPAQISVARSCTANSIVSQTFSPIMTGARDDEDDDADRGGASAGGQSGLAQQLEMVARCVKAGVPTTVYTVSLGGFDTHADEKGTQEALLATLDASLSAFLGQMAGTPNGQGVVVLTYSEFGRRVQANASEGTDHGTAGPVFLAGVPVRGGFYGEQPSLTDLDNGDLKSTVDFRQVYAELLSGVLRTDPEQILGTNPDILGLLQPA